MKKMDQLLEVIREENLNIYSVTEISDGQSVTVNLKDCELSESPVCRNVYSVAKAFTMAAVGFLYDEGKIRLEDTIGQVLGTLPEGSDPKWGEVTVEDLIRHKTGYLKKEDPVQMFDLDVHDMRAYTQGDWLAFILGRPITGQHGVDGSYTDTGYYVLSRMVAKKAGRPMQDYLREKLFNPTHFAGTRLRRNRPDYLLHRYGQAGPNLAANGQVGRKAAAFGGMDSPFAHAGLCIWPSAGQSQCVQQGRHVQSAADVLLRRGLRHRHSGLHARGLQD